MKKKKEKNFWLKMKEIHASGTLAKSRASELRSDSNIKHVTVAKEKEGYTINYSIAKWYHDNITKANVKI
jgi:hypothetical protein